MSHAHDVHLLCVLHFVGLQRLQLFDEGDRRQAVFVRVLGFRHLGSPWSFWRRLPPFNVSFKVYRSGETGYRSNARMVLSIRS